LAGNGAETRMGFGRGKPPWTFGAAMADTGLLAGLLGPTGLVVEGGAPQDIPAGLLKLIERDGDGVALHQALVLCRHSRAAWLAIMRPSVCPGRRSHQVPAAEPRRGSRFHFFAFGPVTSSVGAFSVKRSFEV
jgi:hypothetical protein